MRVLLPPDPQTLRDLLEVPEEELRTNGALLREGLADVLRKEGEGAYILSNFFLTFF